VKKAVISSLLLIAVPVVIGLNGCGKEKDSPTAPTDNDPQTFQTFSEEFEGVSELTAGMQEMTLLFIDSLLAGPPPGAPAALQATITLTWVVSIDSWVCTAEEFVPEDSMTYTIVDTVRFMHGVNIVQWPKEDSLTQVTSRLWLTAVGPGDNQGDGHQFVTIVKQGTAPDEVLVINGSGGLNAQFAYTDIVDTDTTTCSGTAAFTSTVTNVTFDYQNMWDQYGELNCPVSGIMYYTGNLDMTCTGAAPGSLTGGWTVSETFSDGMVNLVVSNGSFTWTGSYPCGPGAAVSPRWVGHR